MTLSHSIIYIYKYELLADDLVNTVSFHTTYVMSAGINKGRTIRKSSRKRTRGLIKHLESVGKPEEISDVNISELPEFDISELPGFDISELPKTSELNTPKYTPKYTKVQQEDEPGDIYGSMENLTREKFTEVVHGLMEFLDTPPTTP